MTKRAESYRPTNQISTTQESRRNPMSSYPKRFDPINLLSHTELPYLRRIAENACVPSTMFEYLALHEDPVIREAVADNQNTPLETLWLLAADECPDVRYALAENHNLPMPILVALREDENPYVAARAATTISRLSESIVITADFHDRGQSARVRIC